MSNESTRQVLVVPFQHIESLLLNYISNEIKVTFDLSVELVNKQPLPSNSYNQYRDQYRTNAFLDALTRFRKNNNMVIGICDVDIYAPNTEYVFNIADIERKVAVVSITRLKPIYYNMYQDENIFWGRVIKEIFHTLGRLYGLEHCYRAECVMFLSNTILSVDIKSNRFCGDCRKLLQIATERSKVNPK